MGAMALPRRGSLSKTQASSSDIPPPLHIIKRTKTVEFYPKVRREMINGSVDYGPDRPLSVMKKRQRRHPDEAVASSAHTCGNQNTDSESTFRIRDHISKADVIPPFRQKPKPQASARWFSRQRTSSSGTTCRRYDLRSGSTSSKGSSIGQSSILGPCDSRCSSQMDASFYSIPMSADYSDDCHLLVPRISVTPEVQSFDGTISTVWAAIEISVQLSRPFADGLLDSHPDSAFLLSNPLRPGSVSRFGYLYNLQVDVIPVQQTTVIEVIQGDNKSLNLGSSMLVLAKVQIDARQSRQPNKAITQRSNELIADLECELGVPTMRYLQACLRYRHSGFPVLNSIAPINGTIDCQTSLETTVTGVIEQQALNGASVLPIASSSVSSLFDIVASYWGPFRANEIFSRKAYDQPITAVKGTTKFSNNLKTKSTEDITTYQPEKVLDPFTPMPRRPVGIQPSSPDEDPARKIWTEMRRRSSRSRPSAENPPTTTAMSIFGRISANTGSLSSLRMRSEVDRRREVIRDVALRNKRSIGADSLKSLVPSMMNLDGSSKESWADESSNASNKENVPPERRKEGRWSIAGWW